jgi:sarcosine oxidase gamma subunit
MNTPCQKELILVGPPVSKAAQHQVGLRHYQPPRWAEKHRCTDCRQRIWLGPQQLTVLKDKPETKIQCWVCAKKGRITMMVDLGGEGGKYVTADGRMIGGPAPQN